MDTNTIPVSTVLISVASVTLDTLDIVAQASLQSLRLYQLYGPTGLIPSIFGSRTTWCLEAQVLGRVRDEDALAFKTSVQEHCTMISVAAAIVAQIAVTSLTLADLSKTHWVARGFLSFSLVSALMAVYYATTQHRVLGHLLKARQIRQWIRGGTLLSNQGARVVPSFTNITFKAIEQLCRARGRPLSAEQLRILERRLRYSFSFIGLITTLSPLELRESPVTFGPLVDPCDPDELTAPNIPEADFKGSLRRICFTPSVSAVITMSAPQALLTSSLFSLFVALGLYFGFVWTRNLDPDADLYESRNVFIMYIVGLGVCLAVYSLSQIIQDEDKRPEVAILDDYIKDYVRDHNIDTVTQWSVNYYVDEGCIHFTAAANDGNAP